MQEDTNQDGKILGGKHSVGSDPPRSDHEVINITSLAISYSPSNGSPSRVIGPASLCPMAMPLIKDSAMTEMFVEVKKGSVPEETMHGDNKFSPLKSPFLDQVLGVGLLGTTTEASPISVPHRPLCLRRKCSSLGWCSGKMLLPTLCLGRNLPLSLCHEVTSNHYIWRLL
jgi:hypothetical protein